MGCQGLNWLVSSLGWRSKVGQEVLKEPCNYKNKAKVVLLSQVSINKTLRGTCKHHNLGEGKLGARVQEVDSVVVLEACCE